MSGGRLNGRLTKIDNYISTIRRLSKQLWNAVAKKKTVPKLEGQKYNFNPALIRL